MVGGSLAGEKRTWKAALLVAVYLVTAAMVCALVAQLCAIRYVTVAADQPGRTDLRSFDFDRHIAQIATESTASVYIYAGAFYTPEDFAAGPVPTRGVLYDRTEGAQGEYGTLRIQLLLPPGEVYALAAKNPSYAQRLFINGKEYTAIGTPGDSAEATVPKTARFVEAFVPEGEETEIVFHYANFVHADGGGLYPIMVGRVGGIVRNEQLAVIRTTALAGALGIIMLFFFGLFLFFKSCRYLLWFALVCGCIAFSLLGPVILPLLAPRLDWYLQMRLAYINTCCIALFSALYIGSLFPGAAGKWAMGGFVAFCGGYISFVLLTPTTVFTRYPVSLPLVGAAFIGWMLLAILIRSIRGRQSCALSKPEQRLILLGLIVFAGLAVADLFAHQRAVLLFGMAYHGVGMLAFLFVNMLALVMGFSRTERELSAVRESERQIREANRLLEGVNRAKTDFLGSISHEMKTPLAVISSYAGLTISQLQKNAVDDQTVDNLNCIQQEAVRLGRLAEQLMKGSVEKERQMTLSVTQGGALLERAAAFCRPICRGNGNRIIVDYPAVTLALQVNADAVFQVLLNLITNANRQMQDGVIALSAGVEGEKGRVVFSVADSGRGIAPELLERVFVRGVSGDGGSGLGLAICKEIIQEHGGDMWIESSGGGTLVGFALPCAEGVTQL